VHVRRLARISALQALYELDTTSHPADQVIAYRLADHPMPAEGEAFLRDRHGRFRRSPSLIVTSCESLSLNSLLAPRAACHP
jgi:hypothetical protein